MSLSAHTPSLAGRPPMGGADWGDSPYGSLISLGPKRLKKKPVLVLDDEELAQAHLAMALGGAEIMDMQPDPVEAPRPRPPAMLLGLAPMGAGDDEDLSAYPAAAAAAGAAEPDEPDWSLPEPDEDEPEEEAEVQAWVPEDEPGDDCEDLPAANLASDHVADGDPAPAWAPELSAQSFDPDPPLPSIEEQMARMRERLAQRAAKVATQPAPAAQPPVAAPAPVPERKSTIERLELDDWSQGESLKGFIPPQERDLRPAAPPPLPAPPVAAPAPPPEPQPEPVFELEPAFAPQPEPVAAQPAEPEVPAWLDLGEHDMVDGYDDEDLPPEPVSARIAAGSANTLRARMVDRTALFEREPDLPPSLFARLWSFLRGRGF